MTSNVDSVIVPCNSVEAYQNANFSNAYGWGNISFKNNKLSFLNTEDILPVKKIQFENYDFYTMNNIDNYLTDFYGEYMSIPVNMEIAKYTTRYKKNCY